MAMAHPAAFVFDAAPRVNLMPRTIVEKRDRGSLIRRWLWALLAAVLVVVMAVVVAFVLQVASAARLLAENARTTTLLSQVAALQPVQAKLDLSAELETFRTEAMVTDFEWTSLESRIVSALPAGVTVTAFTFAPGGAPVGEDPLAEIGATGTLTLASPTPIDIVPLIRTLRGVEGVYFADGNELAAEEGGYRYGLTVSFDQSVYTNAYAEEVAP